MRFVFKLRQCIGAPAIPIVKSGDAVQRGEVIAKKPEGSLGGNIFSSIDGKVVEVNEEDISIEETDTDFSGYIPLKG